MKGPQKTSFAPLELQKRASTTGAQIPLTSDLNALRGRKHAYRKKYKQKRKEKCKKKKKNRRSKTRRRGRDKIEISVLRNRRIRIKLSKCEFLKIKD
jgi:hypothetical protein